MTGNTFIVFQESEIYPVLFRAQPYGSTTCCKAMDNAMQPAGRAGATCRHWNHSPTFHSEQQHGLAMAVGSPYSACCYNMSMTR